MIVRPGLRAIASSAMVALAICLLGADAPGVQIVNAETVFHDVAAARTLTVTAFVLEPGSAMLTALATACDHGARVSVELDHPDFAYVRRANGRAIAMLRAHGCHVRYAKRALHMKVALLGHVMFLSDKNFAVGGLFVRDTRAGDRSIVAATLLGQDPPPSDHFWTRKADAIAAEAQVMQSAQHTLFVESESFGPGTPVYNALISRRRAGVAVYLLVASREYGQSARERAAVDDLVRYGVVVRLSNQDAKLAVPDQSGAWIGSANATAGLPNQVDFGMLLPTREGADAIAARFHADWAASSAL